jgi:RimJ/RimL family protein N-acetyltransferase
MISGRLRYEPVVLGDLDAFHTLVRDAHIRRYLMDGNIMPREWTEDRIRASHALFEERGVGLWLAYEKVTGTLVGFCGFLEIPAIHPEPQLVYALIERFAGQGYATEMASASIAEARRHSRFAEIIAGVDAVNVASLRVFEKLGFERVETRQGAFGNMFVLRLVNG